MVVRHWVLRALIVALLLTAPAPLSAQGTRSVVVADFEDQSVDGMRIGATRLSADLSTLVAAAGRGRLTVVPVDQLRDVMRAAALDYPISRTPVAAAKWPRPSARSGSSRDGGRYWSWTAPTLR